MAAQRATVARVTPPITDADVQPPNGPLEADFNTVLREAKDWAAHYRSNQVWPGWQARINQFQQQGVLPQQQVPLPVQGQWLGAIWVNPGPYLPPYQYPAAPGGPPG